MQVDTSVANHLSELPELTHAIKYLPVSHATRESLTAAWKQWVEEAGGLCYRHATSTQADHAIMHLTCISQLTVPPACADFTGSLDTQ